MGTIVSIDRKEFRPLYEKAWGKLSDETRERLKCLGIRAPADFKFLRIRGRGRYVFRRKTVSDPEDINACLEFALTLLGVMANSIRSLSQEKGEKTEKISPEK